MSRYVLCVLILAASVVACGCAAGTADRPVAVAGEIAPSLVRVQLTLRYDKAEEPESGGWFLRARGDLSGALKEERPFEVVGFVISPTQVVTTDLMVHPRFVQATAVRQGDDVVKAKPA
ncbi:MAG: hypothetical protein NT049_14615, partial [Planctomycetota bacterium]|nr:hypothetical protein [Planctomycetota bacterium]